RDGRVVSTRTWLENPFRERPCAKGRTNIQRMYNPNRLKYPMKRTGERGENKWERISWDEAISTIADNLKRIMDKYGPQSVMVATGAGSQSSINGVQNGSLGNRLINVLGWTPVGMCNDDAVAYGMQKSLGGGIYKFPSLMASPASKTVIVWSQNVGPAQPQTWKTVMSRKQTGSKIVVVDPQFTTIASKADLWVHPRPGSDPALILSLVQVIISEGLENKQYLLAHTVAPVLIRQDNKRYLRMSDVTGGPRSAANDKASMGGQYCHVSEFNPKNDVSDDLPMVWDPATNAPVALDAIAAPAMSGSFEVKGIKVKTAFDMLAESLQDYTPEKASSLCDVDAETIKELAHLCVGIPVAHFMGYGSQSYNNGVQVGHALGTLMAVTGDIGIPGGGSSAASEVEMNNDYFSPTGVRRIYIPRISLYDILKTGKYNGEDYPLKALYISGAGAMVGGAPDYNRTREELLSQMEFIFSVDIAFNDAVKYADIILPAAVIYEKADICCAGGFSFRYYDKCVDPLYECKPDGEIVKLLGQALGAGEYFNHTEEEFMEMVLDCDWLRKRGITLPALREKHMLPLAPVYTCKDGIFESSTKRAEFYVDYPVPRVQYGQDYDFDAEHLPRFFEPYEAWPESDAMKKYPLVLNSTRVHQRFHTQYFDCSWLLETDKEPTVRINPKDAVSRNIKDNAYVEVYNDRGHVVVRALYSEGVKPGCLVYPKGWQESQHKVGHWSELSSSVFDPVGLNNSFFDAAVDVRPWNKEV
ncbi:MAG: molybdopterin-dependent oxidoreductase, partial [Clostridia bacterium]